MKKKLAILMSVIMAVSLMSITSYAFEIASDDVPMPKSLDDPEVAAAIEEVESSEDFYESGWDATWRYDESTYDIYFNTFTDVSLSLPQSLRRHPPAPLHPAPIRTVLSSRVLAW